MCVCVLQHSELAGDCGVPVGHGGRDGGMVLMGSVMCVLQHSELSGDRGVPVGHGDGMMLMGDVYVCVAVS